MVSWLGANTLVLVNIVTLCWAWSVVQAGKPFQINSAFCPLWNG